jgi:FKBP-type peptidyl-prolyl cis-trans isomerase SlyD
MKISENSVVSFHFTLKDAQGKVIESSSGSEPLVYMHGSGSIVPGLEEALAGRNKGDKFNVQLPPEKAYGERNEKLVQRVPKSQFPDAKQLEVGSQFQVSTPGGPMILTIRELTENEVVVDGNPELAGMTLAFDIEIVDVRAATKEEIEHGHAHGPGGHHHH